MEKVYVSCLIYQHQTVLRWSDRLFIHLLLIWWKPPIISVPSIYLQCASMCVYVDQMDLKRDPGTLFLYKVIYTEIDREKKNLFNDSTCKIDLSTYVCRFKTPVCSVYRVYRILIIKYIKENFQKDVKFRLKGFKTDHERWWTFWSESKCLFARRFRNQSEKDFQDWATLTLITSIKSLT